MLLQLASFSKFLANLEFISICHQKNTHRLRVTGEGLRRYGQGSEMGMGIFNSKFVIVFWVSQRMTS
jgi:hypothetical protein